MEKNNETYSELEQKLNDLYADYDVTIKSYEKLQKDYDELNRKYVKLINAIWEAL